ncbi:MAG TPA: response regulator [Bryobacteraceae bacterium]|nr:response regulator [Bryobacteraceae bacterium]
MRIVVVEDNPADFRLFKEALTFLGIAADICHFPDGVTAAAAIRAEQAPWKPPPDLVFLDLNMPRVSGFEVLELLRSTPDCAAVPVAVFTSSQAPSDADRAAKLNADRFLRKPTSLREFFDVVEGTIRELASPATP